MQNWLKVVTLSILTVATFAQAAEGDADTTVTSTPSVTETIAQPSEAAVIGVFEIRPSYTTKSGKVVGEDFVEAGYQINKDLSISYVQGLEHNMWQGHREAGQTGLDLYATGDSFLRAKINNIYVSADGNTSLSYQPRIYFPIIQADRDNGMVTKLRQYLTLSQKIDETFSVSLSYVNVLHAFSQAAGTVNADTGIASANKNIENRLYLIGSAKLSDKLSFSLPLFLYQSHYREAGAGVENSNAWSYAMDSWPELSYAIDSNYSVGAAFRTDNLLDGVSEALENGVAQLVFHANL